MDEPEPKHAEPSEVPPPLINRRLYARFPVKLKAKIVVKDSGKELDGEVLDVSVGGALLRVSGALVGDIRVSFNLDGVDCAFDARVVRSASKPKLGEKPKFGVEFHRDVAMQERLKSLLPPKNPA